ncbi:FAD-dependent monooxygenase [Nocardia sp. BMG51109]|uniref:FAD-dependent monooxygenase n=1 Tax=Nocardia sp. BMG51109 TaxID=1056816 RepID=UPI0004AD0DF9|nr:FAD-dependent monooxygenase [Nocardia sp. BMG51109]
MMYDVHPPRVLIVGGGLVGLSAALFLQHQGVSAALVERRRGTSPQPKARRINIRTMELFRQAGIAEEVLEAARGLAAHQAMAAGPTLAQARQLPFTLPGGIPQWDTLTPAPACLCAQDLLEPTLRRLAERRGCDLRFDTECVEFTEDTTGIEAVLRAGDGTVERLRADYLIAADGAASPIRERLGIARSGRGTLGRAVNVYFRADLRELVRGREFNLCQIENDSVPGTFASVDGEFRWIFTTGEGVDRPAERWPEALRTAIGAPGLDVELLSVLPWESGMFVADRYRSGRVFLAGDAAHVMPPYAAAGANTGIQDAHNLAWKLAHVLHGAAGEALLDSYHAERHPIGWYTADQSSVRIANLRALNTESTDGTPLADPIALILGARCHSAAVIDDGSPHTMTRLDLAGQPGTRLPHHFLPGGRSALDLVDTRCALLIGPDGRAWRAQEAPVEVHEMDETWCTAAGLTRSGALLVRPDQIVAWRSPALPADPGSALRSALDRILDRGIPASPGAGRRSSVGAMPDSPAAQ